MNRSAQSLVRQRDCLRLKVRITGESEEKLFVGEHILEHRIEKRRVFRRLPQIMGTKPGQTDESVKPLRVGCEKGQRRGG